MFMVYLRILWALILLIIFYITFIFFVPMVWEKIDVSLGITWNDDLNKKIRWIIWKVEEAESSLENKLDNPAPNTTRNIEGRMGQ